MVSRLSTGVTVLDKELSGGIPSGGLIVLEADPASQSDLFIYSFAQPRPTRIITTQRRAKTLETEFDEYATTDADDIDIQPAIGTTTESLELAAAATDSLPDDSTLIITEGDVLEAADPIDYRRFLNDLRERLRATDSVGVIHCLSHDAAPDTRAITESMADAVFQLQTHIDGMDIENQLLIPKFRGGPTVDEAVKLTLDGEVRVDTSRDIA